MSGVERAAARGGASRALLRVGCAEGRPPLGNAMHVEIRLAKASDHAELAPLFSALDRLHRENVPGMFREPEGDPRPIAWLEQMVASPNAAIFVADAGGCVGLATVMLRDAPDFPVFVPQRRATLDNLFVDPSWRGRGAGRLLFDACHDWAREHGASSLDATVYEFNAEAQRFFEALGFVGATRTVRKELGG